MALPATLLRDWEEEELDDEEEEDDDLYPSSDGEPVGETDWHILEMNSSIECLRAYYADRPGVYVAGDNFLYYEEGNPAAVVSPDCYVVFGAEMRLRRVYKVWEEGDRFPSVVIEFTSRKTRREDNIVKFGRYEQFGVSEYFQFDPSEYKRRRVRLKGWRLENGKYTEIPLTGAKFSGRLFSEQLQLELVQDENRLRFYNPRTGEFLRRYAESESERQAEKQRAEAERLRADRAEAELAALRRLLESRKQNNGASES